ncbi:MAG: TetR/AcrR family transcriptional regulator [Caldilineaceae bacterium]
METFASDSKQAILDAAEHIIARDGYAGLSMRELSKQSGLAKSTLYHYFVDKHEIYLSVLERDMEIHRACCRRRGRGTGRRAGAFNAPSECTSICSMSVVVLPSMRCGGRSWRVI